MSPSTPVIRKITEADAEEARRLRLFGLQDTPEAFGSTYEEESNAPVADTIERIRHDSSEGWFRLGAWIDDTMVAHLRVSGFSLKKLAHKGVVTGVYTHPDARRQGIMRMMFSEAFSACESLPIEQLMLTVEETNKAAVAFYESLGFEQYGLEPRALKDGGSYHDEILFLKLLSTAE